MITPLPPEQAIYEPWRLGPTLGALAVALVLWLLIWRRWRRDRGR